MKSSVILKAVLTYIAATSLVFFFFQNCAKVKFSQVGSIDLASNAFCVTNPTAPECLNVAPSVCTFNGNVISEGGTVTAYQNSAVPFGQACVPQVRTCVNGALSGSYTFSQCAAEDALSCTFNGQTIPSGQSVTAYTNSTVPAGSTCVPETRVCTNGILSGSGQYATCTPGGFKSCLFNGVTVGHGQSVTGYTNSTVPFGQTCASAIRTCYDGDLTGSGDFSSCTVGAPASCLFNGKTVAHGQNVTGYLASGVPFGQTCTPEARTCANGILSGTYAFESCNVGSPAACLFNGQTVASGQTVTAYQNSTVPYPQLCSSQARTCTNGSLSGAYQYGSCNEGAPSACLFNGQTVGHGANVTAYATSTVPFGQTCQSEQRTCSNGNLSGTNAYGSCSPGAAASCLFNGQTVNSGNSVTAYTSSTVPYGSTCASQQRTCTNGSLSGTATFASCSVTPGANCSLNGQSVTHGTSVQAYSTATVAYGATCLPQTRTCTNGTLSGTFGNLTCAANPAASCSFNGQTVAHGVAVTAYSTTSVPFGSTCASQQRVCSNGTLSGTYVNASCAVGPAANCTFNGQTVTHGSSVQAHQVATVPFGSTCAPAQTRTCTNGILSGTYANASCSVTAAANCSFNGQSVAHSASVTAYATASVAFGATCSSQLRTCNNGTLSGTNAFASCSPNAPASCTFNGQAITSGTSVTAYQTASVSYGSTCTSQQRLCTNGVLAGTYTNAACSAAPAANCTFNGQTVNHGTSVTAYASTSVAYGSTCSSQQRTCTNGSLSGSNAYASCSVQAAASCNFNGQVIGHGATVTAYTLSSVPFGSTCSSQLRTCTNGSLSGSNAYASCTVQAAASCTFNGQVIGHGGSVRVYQSSSVPYGSQCLSNDRVCYDGVLSATSYTATSCSVQQPASCTISGLTLAHGESRLFYNTTQATGDATCLNEWRNCNNGALSGNYSAVSCSESTTKSCGASTVYWSQSGLVCGGGVGGLAHGGSDFVGHSTNDAYIGSGSASCNNGQWSASGTCSQKIQLSVNGQHCDIGGPWGWRSWDLQCPAGTSPAPPSSVGGCPAGWANHNDMGCYISNRDSRRLMNGCSGADPSDECCIFTCSANAPPPVWTCNRDSVWDYTAGTTYTNTCTCTDNFARSKSTSYIVTKYSECTGTDMYGACTSYSPEVGYCQK